jgi:Mrp family chromosome partitioning ATPase
VTITDLVAALRRFWRPAVVAFLVIFGIGVASIVLRADRYRSDAVLSVEPTNGNLGFDAQQAIQLTIPPTIARLRSPTFIAGIRVRVEPRFRDDPFRILASNDPGTAIINFGIESSTRQAAENAARVAVDKLVAQPGSTRFEISVLSPPGAASSVRAERAPPILGGTFVLGLIVAILGAAAAHRLRPRLPRADEFRDHYGHEVLGEIPRGSVPRSGSDRAKRNGAISPEIVEAFRNLEAKVRMRALAGNGSDLNVSIAVTSWAKSEGVSSVVTNLAGALASYGREVTIVDCDMRRPSVHRLLGLELEPGVADISSGEPIAGLRQRTLYPTLDAVTAGTAKRHPAEIAQEVLPRLLAVLHDRTVIIDTPPMFTAETTGIVARADYVVLVADYLERQPEEIDSALEELALTGTKVLGVVLNRVEIRDSRGRESYAYQPVAPEPPRPAPQRPKPQRPAQERPAARSRSRKPRA